MPQISNSRYTVHASWDDVPHLTDDTKAKILSSTLPHNRKSRMTGLPGLGAGAIYPVEEEDFVCEPFQLPSYYRRAYGLDVGWKKTAAIWAALDPSNDVAYLYTEHYQGHQFPSMHATAIKARGDWIPGLIDPAARGRAQRDGQQLILDYREHGLLLQEADHAIEAGLLEVLDRLSTGRLKVFRTCVNWLMEYRIYRRDKNGVIVKEYDHLMDATRYVVLRLREVAQTQVHARLAQGSVGADAEAGY